MADIKHPFNSLLTETGIGQLKSKVDDILADPTDTLVLVFDHFEDQANLPFEIPVDVKKEGAKYIIELAADLTDEAKDFKLQNLPSEIEQLVLSIREATNEIESLVLDVKSELESLRDRVQDELAKIPYRIEIQDDNGTKKFHIVQTALIEAKLHGMDIDLKSSSITFDTSQIDQLEISADLLFPGLKAENGIDDHKVSLSLNWDGTTFTGNAQNIPAARLQGLNATIAQLNLVISGGNFQSGTQISGEFVFDFLDPGQNGPGTINFQIELLNNGDVRYFAENPEQQELRKGPIQIFFQEIEVVTHTNAPIDVTINGWLQLEGVNNSSGQPVKTDFSLQYADPVFDFVVSNLAPVPLGFGIVSFETIALQIHKNGTLQQSQWEGDLSFPFFDNGSVDFNVQFLDPQTDELKISVSNDAEEVIKKGDFELLLDQYDMHYQNGLLQNITGNGELKIPQVNNGEEIELGISFVRSGQNETLKIEGGNFGTPSIVGLEVNFSKILFQFLNGNFQESDLEGRIKLPDTTDGAGLAFDIEILNEGNDYNINLKEDVPDNELVFGPIKLEVESFLLSVVSNSVNQVNGAGKLELPGLSQKFDFSFDVTINGETTLYRIEINNVQAELSGFEISFTQIVLSSQGGNQFTASAVGSLVLPLFNEGGDLDFDMTFSRGNSYQIQIQSSQDFVKFGDFELKEVAMDMEVVSGSLQNFSATAKLLIPSFEDSVAVSFDYTALDERYLISLSNPVQQEIFGGEINVDSLSIDVREGNLHEGTAKGSFKLPESTGGAGIKFEKTIGSNGKNFTLSLDGTAGESTIEFGELKLEFSSFDLVVQNGDLQSLSGTGSLEIPGMDQPFSFSISFLKDGQDTLFVIEVEEAVASLEGFSLDFELIKIQSKSGDFSAELNGDVTLPVFDGNPFGFDISVDPSQSNYSFEIDGTGQSAEFGMFVLSDLVLGVVVQGGQVNNANGAAKIHIPELTEPNTPFAISVAYSKNSPEVFELTANSLPEVDLAIFTLAIQTLSFRIEDGSFDSGSLTGSMTMPVFSGGDLNFAVVVANNGNSYAVNISSNGTLSGGSLELKDVSLAIAVVNGSLQSSSGSAKFKLPAAEDFTSVSVSYAKANDKITFSAQSPPPLTLGDLTLTFTQFGFSIQNGNLTDADFAGNLQFPAFDNGHNTLAFNFELSESDTYTIQANPGSQVTELKAGDIIVLVENFDLQIQNGDLESISAEAGLRFEGIDNSDGTEPAELSIDFSYEKSSGKYEIGIENNQEVSIAGFELTIEQLTLAFTADQITYPFVFAGKLKIPGFEDGDGEDAVVGVEFEITSDSNWSASIENNAVINLGSIKVTISEIEISKDQGKLKIELKGTLELEGLTGMGGDPAAISVDIMVDSEGAFHVIGEVPDNNAIKVVDAPNIVRIYLSKIGLSRSASNDWDFLLGGLIQNEIVIPGMDDLLPSELLLRELEIGSDFGVDMDIRWPSGMSISFGSSEGEFLIPVNGKFGNAVKLDALKITFQDKGANGLDFGVSFSGASITLGPVAASVEGLGIEANIKKAVINNGIPQGNANFGIVNIDISFKPPTGLGVSLDTPVFTGGGYLFFDSEKGEYAGAVELSFMKMFAVSAIGLINSKMPDGKPGTSVLFIVSVEFSPGIALGFGFFISGLGGILGIHRTIQVERLRDGVRTGTIQNILFPKDIVANISKILTDIREVFPVKRDQFVLGPMAAITWGVPTILRVDLGVAIEFANPVRFGILGVLRVILPDENAALIKIQVAFLGMIDFEKGMLSFDASLFDSKVLTFGLEGDMVLRIGWGAKPDFVLSVGGFHPRFNPPTHLQIPPMKRLTLKILSGNPRLTLTCYFAVTSNTVQFGAGIDFYFGVAGFKVVGEFGFDVLFQFSPFRFIADARARLAVKAGSTTLLSLSLEFSLEGPTPWRAKGTAKFKILFFSVKVRFDVTWGDKKDTKLPDIAVLPLIEEALNDDQNWRSIVVNGSPGMRMKGIKADEGLILTANGSIELNQKIVPLKVEITKFGQFNPADYSHFEVIEVKIGDTTIQTKDVKYIKDTFAPANFLDLKNDEKLALPSFNEQNSGVSLEGTDQLKTGTVVDRQVKYEQLIMDETITRLQALKGMSPSHMTFFSKRGAVAQSALSSYMSKVVNPNKVVLQKPGFAVVGTDDLNPLEEATNLSYMDAVQMAKTSSITGRDSVQVVSSDVLAL
ncbi:DUF6603 domain-containing protein [Algoriphagus sediminis]|uniref:DUF6603 domain-containing protein n=1 Tax=Algoriphagus sediminis TaxID=3057113 RepID=A0ABT7Y9I2_9BACT|nr:DUF6603 domain-containing protein [Algoriphagus sediminis]MDN3203126.1 hypothetical protein [Algoriphagus sediminis]